MAKTRDDLIELVAQNLGILAVGQSLSADDSSVIDQRIDPTNEWLNGKGIAYIPDLDDIDDGWFLPFGAIVAFNCAKPFGISGQSLADLKTLHDNAVTDVYDLARPKGTRQTLNLERFWGWNRGWGR